MQPIRQHEGLVVPLPRVNVDTDQIIPKQFLKRIERTGYGEFLFYDWRYAADRAPAAFVLNDSAYRGGSILVAGKNFGCGSSREHAAWALLDYGFRVVIAPSFADIFATNAFKNGILTITLPEEHVSRLMARAAERNGYRLVVDLEHQTVGDASGWWTAFRTDDFRRRCLLEGLDEIGLTLVHEADITAFEARRPQWLQARAAAR
ncbi:MAG TPA: 3-isopropylmalate dehydratase small subunit [Terriglobales bacterium]|nr:3-isopropylmalate dehydratase small subunit [Terriglobales bacterium]